MAVVGGEHEEGVAGGVGEVGRDACLYVSRGNVSVSVLKQVGWLKLNVGVEAGYAYCSSSDVEPARA